MIHKLFERLIAGNQSAIKKDFVPKTGVEEVKNRVLDTADVEVNRHPIVFFILRPRFVIVLRIDKTKVIPARSSPLRHRIGFALIVFAILLIVEPCA